MKKMFFAVPDRDGKGVTKGKEYVVFMVANFGKQIIISCDDGFLNNYEINGEIKREIKETEQ